MGGRPSPAIELVSKGRIIVSIPAFETFERVWFLTWTTYGSWLPGDSRGFVSPRFEFSPAQRRNNVVGIPYDVGRSKLIAIAKANMRGDVILLERAHAAQLEAQFAETASYRGWTVVVGAVMANHVHLVVGVAGDPEPWVLMRDFKGYASRALNRKFGRRPSDTWWTEQGSKRKVKSARHYRAVLNYVLRQAGALLVFTANDPGERGA